MYHVYFYSTIFVLLQIYLILQLQEVQNLKIKESEITREITERARFFVEDYSSGNGNLQKTVREFYYDNGTGNNKKHMDFIGKLQYVW